METNSLPLVYENLFSILFMLSGKRIQPFLVEKFCDLAGGY